MNRTLAALSILVVAFAAAAGGLALRSARSAPLDSGTALASATPVPLSSAARLVYVAYPGAAGKSSDVIAFDPVSGASQVLVTVPHARGAGVRAFVSPNHATLAIVTPNPSSAGANAPASSSLALMPVSGGPLIAIDPNTSLRAENPPTWSTDGTTIFYSRRTATASQIVSSPVTGHSPAVVYTSTGGDILFFGNTEAGIVLAVGNGRGGNDVVLLRPDGATTTLGAMPPDLTPDVQFAGNLVAFYSVTARGLSVGSLDVAKFGPSTTLANLSHDTFSLSPDGSELLLSDWTNYQAGRTQVRIAALASGTVAAVATRPGRFAQPVPSASWSRDKAWFAVVSEDAQRARGIEVMHRDGSGARLILPPSGGSLVVSGWL